MDNHYHLVVETADANLSKGMRQLNGVYTQTINRRHRRVGHLFQGRFKGILIQKDSHFLEVCRYVVLNPVAAGMAKGPREWAWSSYRATAGQSPASGCLMIDEVLGQFGNRRGSCRQISSICQRRDRASLDMGEFRSAESTGGGRLRRSAQGACERI